MIKMYQNSSNHKKSKEIGNYFYFSQEMLYEAYIIWSCLDIFMNLIDEVSDRIYKEILCIPCD